MPTRTLAIDFGTSNSAAAVLEGNQLHRLPIERDAQTLPTAVFFPLDRGAMQIGAAATAAFIAGEDGRYMRALKSVLGADLFHEPRLIGGQRRTISQIVVAFLAEVRSRAQIATGRQFSSALSGRPVHFHSADPVRDARAEADLRACYLAAGFDSVQFMYEPEAAALASHALGAAGDIGLIVDIGGGTSDFSVFQAVDGRVQILASHGIRLGGTDFDHVVSLTHAMPLLGYGGSLRREMGEGLLPVPNHIYADLATWSKIPFLYTPEARRAVKRMVGFAVEPRKLRRLETVLHDELGHDLAFAVEGGKIDANAGDARATITMGKIEPGLAAPITRTSLDAALRAFQEALQASAAETCRLAGVPPSQIGTVILVGGSSLMGMVEAAARAACPKASIKRSDPFTAVVDGLALAAAEGAD